VRNRNRSNHWVCAGIRHSRVRWPAALNASQLAANCTLASLNVAARPRVLFEFIPIPSIDGYESGFRELVARKADIIFSFQRRRGAWAEVGAQSHDHAADRDARHRL